MKSQPPYARLTLLFAAMMCIAGSTVSASEEDGLDRVEAADPRLRITDGFSLVIDETDGSVHFDRVLEKQGRGFRWDSPGSRMRWRTDSPHVVALLRYSDRHTGTSRNSVGFFRIDGESREAWTFSRPAPGVAELGVAIPAPGDGAFHDYEIVLPYADSVDLVGVEVAIDSRWRAPKPRPRVRWLAFGDSVTHGFTATDVTRSYAFLVAERNDWELVNLGIAGRGTYGPDGSFLASIDADVVSILIGVNDWQAGADLDSFRANYETLLGDLRTGRPETPIFAITPLWVPPSWTPAAANRPLETYRTVIRKVVNGFADPRIKLVEGPALIDHDPELFDPIAVHPNDLGFSQMSERLARTMRDGQMQNAADDTSPTP